MGWLVEGRAFLLSAWSTNVGADVVFMIGSIAGAVGGVRMAKRSVGRSIALAALITWATYAIALTLHGRIGPTVDFSGLSGTGMGSGVSSGPSAGELLAGYLLLPLVGLPGFVFAVLLPAIARRALGRFFLRGR